VTVSLDTGRRAPSYWHTSAAAGKNISKRSLDRITALGGEGLMLRQPGSQYETGRSATLLKVKRFQDADARVIEHLPGTGRHRGRLGALLVVLPDGTTFSVGTGFSDAERERPPAVGSLITFRYQELSDRGVPRFPSFVRNRSDVAVAS
jgi:DNA ligase-1